ncbi:RNA polymerase factor sigma-54 [Legionella sp. W05-934-2]|uniref:RNA polymerase factor sigma-54 n=1 Tax=Legionella sp. W05-934-2 TaxID=1198649 RepID=UPI003462528B
MKASLQLNISQQLTLTPQLQQAIRLLQLSTIDLQQEIQQILETNPLLEATQEEPTNEEPEVKTVEIDDDYQWANLFESAFHNFSEDKQSFENLYSTTTDLHQHLTWQLTLSTLSIVDKVIGAAIIDACHEDGFLTLPIEDIFHSLKQELSELEFDEVIAVKHFLQNLDPIGCCSSDLADCLLVQLNHYPVEEPLKALTKSILSESLTLLGQHNYKQIKKDYRISDDQLNKVLDIIHRLHPKPGEMIQQEFTEYVIPDVIVRKDNGEWQVALNNQSLPKLSINNQYAQLLKQSPNQADSTYLKSNLQEAKWFLKSIQSRQETLLNVARCIMEKQKDFLEHGEVAMKPLVLNDISTELGLHESTVSRVTTQKFIHTPRGLYELKYFFSSQVQTDSGGGCSSTAIRAVIKQLIQEENGKKPLSDSKIANLIAQQGIHVARRTVAKYREAMGIPPSSARKKLS